MKLTKEQLKQIKDRADRATPGPWALFKDCALLAVQTEIDNVCYLSTSDIEADGDLQANAEFIAASRQDVPALLAHIEELESEECVPFESFTKEVSRLCTEIEALRDEKRTLQSLAQNYKKECERLRSQEARLQAEVNEQCRLNGMGSEREAKLLTENARLSSRCAELQQEIERQRCSNGLYITQTLEPKIIQLEDDNEEFLEKVRELERAMEQKSSENERLREALEFYADRDNHGQCIEAMMEDKGEMARAALARPTGSQGKDD